MRKILCFLVILLGIGLLIRTEILGIPIKTTLKVYRDGYVFVNQTIIPLEVIVNTTLLGAPKFLLVLDEGGLPLGYRLNNSLLIVYCGDADRVIVSYYTANITSKEGALWRLSLNFTLINVEIILPKGATLVYSDPLPLKIQALNESLVLFYSESPLTIEYVLEINLNKTTGTAGEKEEKPVGGENILQDPYLIIGTLILVGLAALTLILVKTRRKNEFKFLTEEEKYILEFLRNRKRAFLSEIVKATDLPKTTLWRKIKKLEEMGYLRTTKTPHGLLIEYKHPF